MRPEYNGRMDANTIYQEAKSWRGAIGSAFGFLALIGGALFNFHLNRKRDAALRNDEALVVAATLYSEILALRREAARLAQATASEYERWGIRGDPREPFDRYFLEGNRLSEPMLFKALAGKVGMLRPGLAQAITEFHLNIQEARQWTPLLSHDPERRFTYSPVYVLEPALAAVKEVLPALREMEMMLELKPRQDKFDLEQADRVIRDEQEITEEAQH